MLSKQISLTLGAVILGAVATLAIVVIQPYLSSPDYSIAAIFSVRRPHRVANTTQGEGCVVGQVCEGPTVSAHDPEGDVVTYRFYDQATHKPVAAPITAGSGEPVTPEFKFTSTGEQKLYMVVEDGSGHTSADYPIIIPVKK